MQEIPLYNRNHSADEAYNNACFIKTCVASGTPIYVKVTKPGAREGAIALLKPTTVIDTRNKGWRHFSWVDLEWQDRKNEVSLRYDEVVWLKDYTGPTVWIFEKNKPKPVEAPAIVYDCIGHQIQVDDVVLYTRGYKVFGTVTRITSGGTVYYKIIKIRQSETATEHKAHKPTDMLVIRDGLKKDLMFKKLIME